MDKIGLKIKKIWRDAAKKNDLEISIQGINPLATFKLKTKDWPSTITYFNQKMQKNISVRSMLRKFNARYKKFKYLQKACNLILKK